MTFTILISKIYSFRLSGYVLDHQSGFGAPLNEQETKNFLSAGKLNVHLRAVDEKGHANIHPGTISILRMTRSIKTDRIKLCKPQLYENNLSRFCFKYRTRIILTKQPLAKDTPTGNLTEEIDISIDPAEPLPSNGTVTISTEGAQKEQQTQT